MAGYTLESFTHSLIHHFTTRVHYTTSPSPPPTHSFFIYCLTYAFIQIIQNSRIEPGHIAYAVTPLYNHYSTVIHDIHCPKSYPNFRDVTCNVEENEILHEIFRLVSSFPPLHFMLYLGISITFGTVWKLYVFFFIFVKYFYYILSIVTMNFL